MQIKAAVLYEINTPLRVEEVTLDDPQDRKYWSGWWLQEYVTAIWA